MFKGLNTFMGNTWIYALHVSMVEKHTQLLERCIF